MDRALFVLGAIVQLAFLAPGSVCATKGENRQEFLALCEIIKMAKYFGTERTPFEDPKPTQKIDDIIGNVTMVKKILDGGEERNQTVVLSDGNEYLTRAFKGPLAVAHQGAASKKVQKILDALKGKPGQGAASVKGDIEAKELSVTSAMSRVREEAQRALYGSSKTLSTGSDQTFAASLQTASTTSAGLSLANDVVALCKSGDGGSNNECVDSGTGKNIAATAFATYSNGKDLYDELTKEECKDSRTEWPSPGDVQEALEHFKLLLGRNQATVTTGSYAKPLSSILGKRAYSGTPGCGQNTDVCVDYKEALSSKNGIRWLKEMVQIQKDLVKIQEERQAIKTNLQRARDLEGMAIHELIILDSYEQSNLGAREITGTDKGGSNSKIATQDSPLVTEKNFSTQTAFSKDERHRLFAAVAVLLLI